MNVTLNGEKIEVDGTPTLLEFLKERDFNPTGVAAAINQEFVPRSTYETTTLKADDYIEVVAPMQGG